MRLYIYTVPDTFVFIFRGWTSWKSIKTGACLLHSWSLSCRPTCLCSLDPKRKKKKKSKVKLWIHELYYLLCDPSLYKLFSSLSLLQPSPTQTEVPAGGLTVGGVDSVCWWQKPAAPSVSARRNAGPPSCRCVARTAGSTRTTARSTAPPAWRGDGSTWCTARTASLKVPLEHWCSDTAEGPCAL